MRDTHALDLVVPSGEEFATVTEMVTVALRQSIVLGRLSPGERLDQGRIAELLGVSITPLREAIRVLEGEGLVTLFPNRGAYVAKLGVEQVNELYTMRSAIEALISGLGAERITDDALADLSRVLDLMETCTKNREYARLIEYNREFHFITYRASGMPWVCEFIEQFWNRGARYRYVYICLEGKAAEALKEHRTIYEACRAHDRDSAEKLVREHMEDTRRTVVEYLKTAQGEGGGYHWPESSS